MALRNFAGESVAHPVDGLDGAGLLARETQCLSNFHDALRDHRFRHEVIAPDVLQQLVLARHPTFELQEVQDEVEGSAFNLLGDSVPQQFPGVTADDTVREVVFLPPGPEFFRHLDSFLMKRDALRDHVLKQLNWYLSIKDSKDLPPYSS